MTDQRSMMRAEIEEIPEAIDRLLADSDAELSEAAAAIARTDPALFCTIARGSSDHAATYLKYAIELLARIPVASVGPSIASIYGVTLSTQRCVCLTISQSGQSPDIVASAESLTAGGALSIAITNDRSSPLAHACDKTVDIKAGPEKSVAATKTFVTSIVSGLALLAKWRGDSSLIDALARLPDQAHAAVNVDWGSALETVATEAQSMFVLGRGPSLAIANEAALKFKETCRIQAEPFSTAEVLHGPVSIVSADYPILALIARDRAEQPTCQVADEIASRGANVFATSANVSSAASLPFVGSGHPLTDPLLLIVSFYTFIEKLARVRGLDPDAPRHLNKVTETL